MLGPIFVREWTTLPRRGRHYVSRAAYLGLLWLLAVAAWQALIGWAKTPTLGETARYGRLLFQLWAHVQLTLMLFFAALSAAASIAREKDRGTFPLLLLTDLRNHEIVLGKVLGSLLQVAVLWLATMPMLLGTIALGGVGPAQVLQVGLLLAAAAWAAASVGGLMALWREQTFPALALTVLTLVLYICTARGLEVLTGWPLLGAYLEPYRALQSVLEAADLPEALSPPVHLFTALMLLLGGGLNLLGMARLRTWSRHGEPGGRRQVAEDDDKDRTHAHAAPGAPRAVWANPILWREIRTRAYGRRPLLVKAAYLSVLILVCGFAFLSLAQSDIRPDFAAAYGLVPVAIFSLLLASLQAVTAIMAERDSRSLDLLLATDLTPKEFIFGKIGGVCWNAKEYLLPPLLLAVVYAYLGQLASPPRNHPEMSIYKNVEALIAVVGGLLVVESFTVVLGIHVALRNANSHEAVFQTLGTVFFLSVGTLTCIYLILISNRFEYQWGTFMLFAAAGVGGLWWVLNGERPSTALKIASCLCPAAVLYVVMNVLIGKPGSAESTDPLVPLLVIAGAFSLAIAAMLVPLLSEFDIALGRTTGPE